MNQIDSVLRSIAELTGQSLYFSRLIRGGSIHRACEVRSTSGDRFFLKFNAANAADMFSTETKGLGLLREATDETSAEVVIPRVVESGASPEMNLAWILLEFLDEAVPTQVDALKFGNALAALHTKSGTLGLDHNNYIGSLPQKNIVESDEVISWVDYFIANRLEPQFDMAMGSGRIDSGYRRKINLLYKYLWDVIPDCKPTILHGDLWSGNYMFVKNTDIETGISEVRGAIFDPAVYFGHREVDLAFTRLFGGFSEDFYRGYEESQPLEDGHNERVDYYNLYPLLVHVNLFGGGYIHQVTDILDRF